MTKALLDTNIIIHRENNRVSNESIGHLFYWLDKLKYSKLIHPLTIKEIKKYEHSETQEILDVKLQSYEELKTLISPDKDFLNKLSEYDKTENDRIDTCLLFEVYCGTVNIFITEDKRLINKAKLLKIENKVFSINQFLLKVTAENPALIKYKMLSVETTYFGHVDINSNFFDTFRRDYKEFNEWFKSKSSEEAYICKDDKQNILGFLYLKTEDKNENYSNIEPVFTNKKRLKVGTFKVESTGFRLGERFIKIIFDNAIQYKVDEIYVTLFENRTELEVLVDLLKKWGFYRYGIKKTQNGNEAVFVKDMNTYYTNKSIKENFPNILYNNQKFILPISHQYHTTLLPDSKLNTENKIDFLSKIPHRYALQKVYISWASENNIHDGDIILFYRMGESNTNKRYSSVITTIGIVDKIISNFRDKNEYLNNCQNRTVFTNTELNAFWDRNRYNLKILKFIFVKSLSKRLTLDYLWDKEIIQYPNGPRPFTRISDEQFDKILRDSNTDIKFS